MEIESDMELKAPGTKSSGYAAPRSRCTAPASIGEEEMKHTNTKVC